MKTIRRLNRVWCRRVASCIACMLLLGVIAPAAAASPLTAPVILSAATPAPDGNFGFSVATSGNNVVVGEPYATVQGQSSAGNAYIFTSNGNTWSRADTLSAAIPAPDGNFGYSVGTSGNMVIVGEPRAPADGMADAGDVYILSGNGRTWSRADIVSATAPDGRFGTSVAASGNTMVVGRPGPMDFLPHGDACLFTSTGGRWRQAAIVNETLSATPATGLYGWSVAASGNYVVVGEPWATVNDQPGTGSVYIFTNNGTTWRQVARINATTPTQGAFGSSVAIAGNTIVVGEPYATVNGRTWAGDAYIFTSTGGSWKQTATLTASRPVMNGRFGTSVAIAGNTVVVGQPYLDIGTNYEVGGAFIFTGSGTGWNKVASFTAPHLTTNGHFGQSVAIDGNTVVIGEPGATVNDQAQAGDVYVYTLSQL